MTKPTFEEVEQQAQALADAITPKMNRWIRTFQRTHGAIAIPVVLHVCAIVIAGCVKTWPKNEQRGIMEEVARDIAQTYEAFGVEQKEKPRVMTLN